MVASNVDKLDYRNYVTLGIPVMLPKSQVIACGGGVVSPLPQPVRKTLNDIKQGDILLVLGPKSNDFDIITTVIVCGTKRDSYMVNGGHTSEWVFEWCYQSVDSAGEKFVIGIDSREKNRQVSTIISGNYVGNLLCADEQSAMDILWERFEREEKILRDDIKKTRDWLHSRRAELRHLKRAKKQYSGKL